MDQWRVRRVELLHLFQCNGEGAQNANYHFYIYCLRTKINFCKLVYVCYTHYVYLYPCEVRMCLSLCVTICIYVL